MDLKIVREEIDKIDNSIKNLLVLRMSLIPIVTRIKVENNMELHQPGREEVIYNSIKEFAEKKGVNNELLKGIYSLIISEAISIEKSESLLLKKENGCTMQSEKTINIPGKILEEYKKMEDFLGEELPQIIKNIEDMLPQNNLSEIGTALYERRMKDEL